MAAGVPLPLLARHYCVGKAALRHHRRHAMTAVRDAASVARPVGA
jgi:hypothetical protein